MTRDPRTEDTGSQVLGSQISGSSSTPNIVSLCKQDVCFSPNWNVWTRGDYCGAHWL